jgi:hypothetical protein
MDDFDFEELIADMFGISDEQREDDNVIPDKLYEEFDIDFDSAFKFAHHLLEHVIPVTAGLTDKKYHAFVSKNMPVMLMKIEAKAK